MPRMRSLCRVALTFSAAVGLAGLGSASAVAAPTPIVDLGQASSYAVLSGASVGNTVNAVGAPHTTLRGDLGVVASATPTGFPPGVVTGTTRVGGAAVTQAHADLVTAYTEVAGRSGGTPLAGDLIGATLAPGLYSNGGAVANTGTVTLDGGGDPNAVFVFKVGGALTMAAGANVVLSNGARASHVFWQVNGAAAIGAGAHFAGTLMALDAIAVGAGTQVNGRALARNGAIGLDSDDFYSAPPVVTVTGGATASSTNTTPTITGTTDVAAPALVTVTVAGQTLTATPSGGTWSVTAPILANGTYPVVASATDAAGNSTSTTQSLTIDTVPPVVTIGTGPSRSTNNRTPTFAGTSDTAPGSVVHVTVDAQTLTALVQSDGTWNVAPATLSDGTRTVTASVTDPAGNAGTASQQLTIDTVAPALTVDGGATRLTNDPTPDVTGTTDVATGTIVTVAVAGQTLTATVAAGGSWSATAAALSDGPHAIAVSVSDPSGNQANAAQTLTVDTVAPTIAITGGATATTTNLGPTIAGTTGAPAGTTVTVTIAGQTMTTLVQSDGSWNATPSLVGTGTWPVTAAVPDLAGNVGHASQSLVISAGGGGGGGGGSTSGGGGGGGGSSSGGGSGTAPAGGATGAATPSDPAGPSTTPAKTPAAGTPASPPATGAPSAVRFSLATVLTALHGKRVPVSLVLSAPAKVTLTLRHGKTVVAKLSTNRRKAGRVTLTWNGRIDGRPAAKGRYTVTVIAVPTKGATARRTATLRIT